MSAEQHLPANNHNSLQPSHDMASRRHIPFLRGLVATRPARRRSPGIAGYVCRTLGIGVLTQEGDYIVYAKADFARAAEQLQSLSARPELEPMLREEADLAAPRKDASGPDDHRYLAVMPLHMECAVPPSCFLTITGRAARELRFSAILVCEKPDTLLRLGEFSWLERFTGQRPTLAVYGGNPAGGIYRAEVVRRFIEDSSAAVLALYDFDPRGLYRAAALPRLEALCLPDETALEPALRLRAPGFGFKNDMVVLRARLGQITCQPVAQAWKRMQAAGNAMSVDEFPR